MANFGIKTAAHFLQKLRDEQADFVKSNCLSERHALNAVMTAYHLHEWVWGEFAKTRPDLHLAWALRPANYSGFKSYVFAECRPFADATALTNRTKHFGGQTATGKHAGSFQRGAFQEDAFDVSYLWIERDGKQQSAENFIKELVDFWETFFKKYRATA